MLKLYYSPGACSLAPHIVLQELGEPYEIELVSTMDGSTRDEYYLNINAKGRVPVLCTGEMTMTEAPAIMIYLALNSPQSNLMLNTPLSISRSIEWMNWLSCIHSSIIAQNWRTERFSDEKASYQGIQEKGMKNLREAYTQIDAKLEGSTWATGKHFSIADPHLLVFFRWGNRLGLDMTVFSNWTKHAKLMEQRKSVQSVLSTEGISLWE